MSAAGFHERHLTSEEIVARVFPVHEGAVPVPLHLSVCPDCQRKVARLREAWVLDRGAVEEALEEIPQSFWNEQGSSIQARVREEAAKGPGVASFPLRWTAQVLRRPAVAAASLAAALALVAGISVFRTRAPQVVPPPSIASESRAELPNGLASVADVGDDELLRGVDQALSDELPFRTLIPEEV